MITDTARAALVVEVSQELTAKRHWWTVALHIAEDQTWQPLTEAMRRASIGERDALGEIESLALAARDAVAEQIVSRYLRDHPFEPLPPGRLLAKYPSGNIPHTELLHALQLELAA